MSVPPWKKALMDRKKQKDTEEQEKQVKEDEQLANLPAWKRAIVLKQREKEKKDAAIPPVKPEPQNTPGRSNSSEPLTAAIATSAKPDIKTGTVPISEKRTAPVPSERPAPVLTKSESSDKLAKLDPFAERRKTSVPKSQSYDMLAKFDSPERSTATLSKPEPVFEKQMVSIAKGDSVERQTAGVLPKSPSIDKMANQTAGVLPKSPSIDKIAKGDSVERQTAGVLPKSPSIDKIAKGDSVERQTAGVLPKSPSIDKIANQTAGVLSKSPSIDKIAKSDFSMPRSESIGKLAAAFSKPDLSQKPHSASTLPRPEPPGKATKTTAVFREQANPAPAPEVPKDTAKQAQTVLPSNAGRPVPSSNALPSVVENKFPQQRTPQPAEQPLVVAEVRGDQPQATLPAIQNVTTALPQAASELPRVTSPISVSTANANLPQSTALETNKRNSQDVSSVPAVLPPGPPAVASTSQPHLKSNEKRRSLEEESIRAPVPAWKKALLERKRSSPNLPVVPTGTEQVATESEQHTPVVLKAVKKHGSMSEAATAVMPAPVVTPMPAPVVTPMPAPVVAPMPAPVVVPMPAPVVAPMPAPMVKPIPAPVVTPMPAPVVTPTSASVSIPKVTPVVKPAPPPVSTPKLTPMIAPVSTPKMTPTITPVSTPKMTPTITPVSTPKMTPTVVPKVTQNFTPVDTPKGIPVAMPTATPNVTSGDKTTGVDPSVSAEKRKTSLSTPTKPEPGTQWQRKLSAPPALPAVKPSLLQRPPSLISLPPTPTAPTPPPSTSVSPPPPSTSVSPPPPEIVTSETKEPLKLLHREGVDLRPPVFQEVKEWANVPEDHPQFQNIPQWKKALILRRREDIAKRSGVSASGPPSKPTAEDSGAYQPSSKAAVTPVTPSQATSRDKDRSASLSNQTVRNNNDKVKTGDLAGNDRPKTVVTPAASDGKTTVGTPQGQADNDKTKPSWLGGDKVKYRPTNPGQSAGSDSSQPEGEPASTQPASVKTLLGKFAPRGGQGKDTTPSQVTPSSGKLKSPSGNTVFFPTSGSTPPPPSALKPHPLSPPPDQLSPMRPSEPPSPASTSALRTSPSTESEDSDLEVTNIDDVLDEDLEEGSSCPAPTLIQPIQSDAFLPQESDFVLPVSAKTDGLNQTIGPPSTLAKSSVGISSVILHPPTSPVNPPTSPINPPTSPINPTSPNDSTIKSILVAGDGPAKKKRLRRVSWSDSSLVVQHSYPKYTYDDYDENEGAIKEEEGGDKEGTDGGGGQVLELPVHPMLQTTRTNRDLYSTPLKSVGSPQSSNLHNYKPSIIASYGPLLEDNLNHKGYLSGTEEDTKESVPKVPTSTTVEVEDKVDQPSAAYSTEIAALIW